MIIKRLSASFGGLQNARLNLESGLNIIDAPNERGKSTWCAFIRAMLYGINTAEREKEGFLPEKTKYKPWSGAAMEGAMEVEAGGRIIVIQRRVLGTTPMKKLDVRYSGSGEEVIALMHQNLGETLTGVPEGVFVRSAFIRQAGLKVSQTGELEQRIAALVSGGDESISYSETEKTLKKWRNDRKSNKTTGKIPAIEAEIADIDQSMARLKEAAETYNEISIDLDRAEARRAELAEDLNALIELERRLQRQKVADAKKKVQDLDREISAKQNVLAQNGANFSRARLQDAREAHDKLASLTRQYTHAKTEKENAEKDLRLIEEEQANMGFEGKSIEEAKALVKSAELEDEAAKSASAASRKKYTIPLGLLPIFAIAMLAVSLVWEMRPLMLLSVLAIIAMGVLAFLLYRTWSAANSLVKRRDVTFTKLRVPTIEALHHKLEHYETLSAKVIELKANLEEASAVCEKARDEVDHLKAHLEQTIAQLAPGAGDLEDAIAKMKEIEALAERLEIAEKEREAAAYLMNTLIESYDGDASEAIPQDGLRLPLRSKSETSYDLKRMEGELETLRYSHGRAEGEVRAFGDPVILGARRNALEARLEELNKQYDALSLAMEVLAEADAEIGARFSPLLGKQAGYYLDRLTEGEYKRVVFDKNLIPSAERAGESVSRDILYLSGGTIDQVYFALRLAICDLTFPADRACPIILDDALVSFDDTRLGGALTLLKELAERRQIILFTCQNREAQFFKGDQTVCVVNL